MLFRLAITGRYRVEYRRLTSRKFFNKFARRLHGVAELEIGTLSFFIILEFIMSPKR